MGRTILVVAGLVASSAMPVTHVGSAPQATGPLYGHHLLVRAGASRDLGELGAHLETLHLTTPPAISFDGSTLRALAGGTSCLRFRYRDGGGFNEVQTVCAIVFDDKGKCGKRAATTLDLERFLAGREGGARAGEADYLAQGERIFYGSCQVNGRTRLQRSGKKLPPLMLRVIDAYTDGAGAGDDELDRMRASSLTTYGGDTLSPSWLLPALGPFEALKLKRDGTVSFRRTSCDDAPECTDKPDLARAGDVVFVGHDLPASAELEPLLDNASLAADFVAAHGVADWEPTAGLIAADDVRRRVLSRLIGLALMRQFVELFDGWYGLRAAGIPIAWAGNANARVDVEDACHPDERAVCDSLEGDIAAAEAALVEAWRDAGFEVWWHGWVQFDADGSSRSLREQPPDFREFDNLVLEINLDASPALDAGVETVAVMEGAMAAVAKEVGRKRKVIVSPWAGPMSFFYDGEFCEFEICDSDLSRYYALNEAILSTTIKKFRRKQIVAFAVPLFDGSHFDIRDPHEAEGGTSVNRVGETLFNNPLLNIWLAR